MYCVALRVSHPCVIFIRFSVARIVYFAMFLGVRPLAQVQCRVGIMMNFTPVRPELVEGNEWGGPLAPFDPALQRRAQEAIV